MTPGFLVMSGKIPVGRPSGVLVGLSPLETRELERPMVPEPALYVLVVDDDAAVRKACCTIAEGMGCVAEGAGSLAEARGVLKHRKVDVVLLDLKLPDGGGLELLEQLRTLYPETAVVVMTAFATVSSAVEAMRIGARDYLTKPFALEELTTVIERAGQRIHFDRESRLLRERLRSQTDDSGLIGRSPEMEKLYRILSKVAFSTHPVLILGESGTGKELVARSIHNNGPNAARPFVPIDCGALDPAQIERELFGYSKGAFAGAERAKEGLLSLKNGATVFLDEIGELPLELQSRLLRALQEKEIRPLGSPEGRPLSARILAATNRDLPAMVETGKFRKDLYFRLNVVNLKIPPLRERRADIPLLAMYFLAKIERETGLERRLSDDSLRVLAEYDWPGNVRELETAIERACALSSGPILHLGDLPTQLQDLRLHREAVAQTMAEEQGGRISQGGSSGNGPIVSIFEMEKQAILGTIRQLKGDKLLAAKLLGIGKTTLYRKLKEYGISDVMEGFES